MLSFINIFKQFKYHMFYTYTFNVHINLYNIYTTTYINLHEINFDQDIT